MQVKPEYFDKFHCLMSACHSTCCMGWEIDIDNDTLKKYKKSKNALFVTLRDNICEDSEGAYIKLNDKGRCPLLDDNNLCRLCIDSGETALCETCHEFPRFYNQLGDYMEMGLSLSCEESIRLILNDKNGIHFIVSGESNDLYDDEKEDIKEKFEYIKTMQDTKYSLKENILRLKKLAKCDTLKCYDSVIDTIKNLDFMDLNYADSFKSLYVNENIISLSSSEFQNLVIYFLYRYILNYDFQYSSEVVVCFSLVMTYMLDSLIAKSDDKVMTILNFSREIESSVDNVDSIMSTIYKSLF